MIGPNVIPATSHHYSYRSGVQSICIFIESCFLQLAGGKDLWRCLLMD